MDTANVIQGVNGSTALNEAGCGKMVAFFTSLVRGLEDDYIKKSINDILGTSASADTRVQLEDLVVMAYQTRDIRGGKGERDLFYTMMECLAPRIGDNDVLKKLFELVPTYGYWGDMWKLGTPVRKNNLIAEIAAAQIVADEAAVASAAGASESNISLIAKWLPREKGKEQKAWVDAIRRVLNCSRKEYRKRVAALNKHLKTVEINMCAGTWADIKASAVPGRNMFLHKKAFLNELLKKKGDMLRHPDDKDRMACRENFRAFFDKVATGQAKIHGGDVLMPHEVLHSLERTGRSTPEGQALEGQWRAVGEKFDGKLNKMICMADFSGSMEGRPMDVSLALGLIIAERTAPAFRNKLITFDTTPALITFSETDTVWDKIAKCRAAPWGGSTNFEAAYELVLQTLCDNKVAPGDEPDDLLVLTDMGWDAATAGTAAGAGAFHLDKLKAKFKAAGDWKVPRIIIWNLASHFKQYQASETTPGVVMISGWHPSILARLIEGVKVTTPWDGMRWILDAERYAPIRATLSRATQLKDSAPNDK